MDIRNYIVPHIEDRPAGKTKWTVPIGAVGVPTVVDVSFATSDLHPNSFFKCSDPNVSIVVKGIYPEGVQLTLTITDLATIGDSDIIITNGVVSNEDFIPGNSTARLSLVANGTPVSVDNATFIPKTSFIPIIQGVIAPPSFGAGTIIECNYSVYNGKCKADYYFDQSLGGTAGSGSYLMSLPPIPIDPNLKTSNQGGGGGTNSNIGQNIGFGEIYWFGNNSGEFMVQLYDSTRFWAIGHAFNFAQNFWSSTSYQLSHPVITYSFNIEYDIA